MYDITRCGVRCVGLRVCVNSSVRLAVEYYLLSVVGPTFQIPSLFSHKLVSDQKSLKLVAELLDLSRRVSHVSRYSRPT